MAKPRKTILLMAALSLGILAGPPAQAALPGLGAVKAKMMSFKAKQVLEATIWENSSSEPATLTIIDRFAPVGHALIVDAENGNLIQDLTSSGDSFELPARSKVGLVFLPTAKVIGLTFRMKAGGDALEFNLKKQCAVSFYGDPKWDVRKETERIQFNRSAFEKPGEGVCWEVLSR